MSLTHLQLRRRPGVAGLAVVVAILAPLRTSAPVRAAEPHGPARAPALIVQDLLGPDWKARKLAREEALSQGARVLPRLLEARAAQPLRHDRREALDDVLRGIVPALAGEVLRPLGEGAERVAADAALGGVLGACDRERPDEVFTRLSVDELGNEGSADAIEPVDWVGRRDRARRARGALLVCGPAVTGALVKVPPVREVGQLQALWLVVERIWQVERAEALAATTPAARDAFLARYQGILDLCGPILQLGLRDPEAQVRGLYQTLRDQALATTLPALDAAEPQVRAAAEAALQRLGALVRPSLLRLARGEEPASPQVREVAARLAHRIRLGVSDELVRRLGDDLSGYDELDFRARRARLLELERLGGQESVPVLRALLDEEASDELRSLAAVALFRLGDPAGPAWLALHGGQADVVRISRRELAAIFMDQGLRYLQLGRFERAEHEFQRALELEPQNETTWYNLACTYARWGKLDQAIDHLRQAVEHGFDDVTHMEKDSDLDSLRQDPRFREIIAGLQARRSGQ